MGTDKRQRKKANRAERRATETRIEKRRAMQRRATRIGILAVAGVVAVVAIAWFAGAFDSEDTATDTTAAETTAPLEVTECPPVEGVATPVRSFAGPPPFCLDPDVTYSAELTTNFGEITIELDQDAAPETVNNFVVLARYGYYDDTVCHRIIPDFVVQCGDPTGTGTGGPGYTFPDELPEAGQYVLGSVAMANSGPDTNGSQFFIITGPQGESLPPSYSLFGDVTAGLDTTVAAMDAVGTPEGAPSEEVRIARVRIVES